MLHLNLLRYKEVKKKSKKKKIISLLSLLIAFLFVLISGSITFFKPSPVIKRENTTLETKITYIWNEITRHILDNYRQSELKIENKVRRGDNIINILKQEGIDHQTAYKLFIDVKPIYNLRKIRTGKKYILFLSSYGKKIKKFRYEIDDNHYLEAFRDESNNRFRAKIISIPYEFRKVIIKGVINYSLFESILNHGEKPELADIMASLYEYDIDFNRDIRANDSFAIIVEKKYLNGKFVKYGHILATEFINRGKVIRVIRFTDPEGQTAYYHPDGRSVRKMFLRCPLPFMRISSTYGNRLHPVLGFSTRHNGVDFAAPTGTKIRASATGVIRRIAYNSGKGRYIVIRHPNHYASHYYHLYRIAKNIRIGVKVEQGQVIGYVGCTGLCTGPHLHYSLQKNGRFLNPLQIKSPSKNPVKKIYFEDFKHFAARHFLLIAGDKFINIPKALKDALLGTSDNRKIQTSASSLNL